ncbi:unnamed protein product [Auanema sp. JU1783]|nr:unnamed protein product [Auanema sp. JU1783]
MKTVNILRITQNITQIRGLLKPPRNLPYRGLYRTEGETVRKDDLLLCQGSFNYHPGLNVIYENDRGEKLLKATCDGVVRITTEEIQPDMSIPEMSVYEHKIEYGVRKLTFNVIPFPMSQSFELKAEI